MQLKDEYNGKSKMRLHTDRVFQFLGGENVYPITIEVNLTNACNYACPWCSEQESRNMFSAASIKKDVMLKALVDMKNGGVRSVTFEGGGEPTVHPHFEAIINNAPDMDYGLITNGSRLHVLSKETIARLKYIRVSLDASDRETYKLIHGVDGFDDVIYGMRRVGAINCRGVLGVSYIVSNDTVPGMVEAAHLARDLGADYIQYKPLLGRNWKFVYCSMGNMLDAVMQFNDPPNFSVFLSRFSPEEIGTSYGKRDYKFCRAHRFIGAVAATGSVELCCNLKHKYLNGEYSFGELSENVSFKDIWESERRMKIINIVETDTSFLKKVCVYCRMNDFNELLESAVEGSIYNPLWRFL